MNYVSFDWPATGDSPPTRDTPSQKRATPQKVSKNLNLGQTRQIPAKKHVSTSGITRQSVELDDEMSQSMQVCHRYVAGMSQVCFGRGLDSNPGSHGYKRSTFIGSRYPCHRSGCLQGTCIPLTQLSRYPCHRSGCLQGTCIPLTLSYLVIPATGQGACRAPAYP